MQAGVERSWQSSDGLALFARDYAGAPGPARCPVICLHGLTRNSLDFEDFAPWVAAQGRRVIAMDVRGRGRSARPEDAASYRPAVYAKDVLGFMGALGIARAVFVGTSMGGIITMAIAGGRLRAIAAAVLNDVGPKLAMGGLQRIAGYVGKPIPVTSWEGAAEVVRELNRVAFPDNTAEEWQRWARRAFVINAEGRFVLNYDKRIALAFQGKPLKSTSLVAKLLFRRLANNRPTLLIRGALSDLLGAEEERYMRAVAPTMQVAAVPGVGHAPMLMEAEACEAIGRFLQQVP